jgi:hypothetical protein
MRVDILKALFADFILTLNTIIPYCTQNYESEELFYVSLLTNYIIFLWTQYTITSPTFYLIFKILQ